MPPNHSFLAAALQLALVRAQLEHGDFVGVDVGQQPFVVYRPLLSFERISTAWSMVSAYCMAWRMRDASAGPVMSKSGLPDGRLEQQAGRRR